jgi:hypothetical protein
MGDSDIGEDAMSDDLVKRLRKWDYGESTWGLLEEAADCIEKLEEENTRLCANAVSDTKLLMAYHHWCKMNGCAPSSKDLSVARVELAGEKKDD